MEKYSELSEYYMTKSGKVEVYTNTYLLCNDMWNYIKEFMFDKAKYNYLYYNFKIAPFRWFGSISEFYLDYGCDDYETSDDEDEDRYYTPYIDNKHINALRQIKYEVGGNYKELISDLRELLESRGLNFKYLLKTEVDASKFFDILSKSNYGWKYNSCINKLYSIGNLYVKQNMANAVNIEEYNTFNPIEIDTTTPFIRRKRDRYGEYIEDSVNEHNHRQYEEEEEYDYDYNDEYEEYEDQYR